MSEQSARALDARLAALLQIGTVVAASVVAAGLLVPSGGMLVTAGIGLFIALPVLRVAVMTVEFARLRDHRIAVVSALVLAVILLAFVVGARMNRVAG